MLKQKFPTDSPYLQSVQGLHRLHALALSGKEDDAEADALRATLERPWHQLKEGDRRRITGLSEDLYSLSEPISSPLPMDPQAQRKLVEAIEARQSGDWDKALELLRRWSRYVEPALLAYLRGTVWMEGEDYGTAALFFQRAAQLDPVNENFARLYLLALERSDGAAAQSRAQEVLADAEAHPPAVVE